MNAAVCYLGPVEWGGLWQRPQQEASLLAADRTVLYVNPVATRSPRLSDLARVGAWLEGSRGVRAPAGLAVAGFWHLPFQSGWCDVVNRHLFAVQAGRQGLRPGYTLVITTPSLLALSLLESTRPGKVVYSCMDNFPAFHRGEPAARMREAEAAILERCDTVIVTSVELLTRMSKRHRNVVLSPNGADVQRFLGSPDRTARLTPVLGYSGTIGDWVDFELLERLADALPHAEIRLVGPWRATGGRALLRRANVRHLGERGRDEMPEVLRSFEVGLIPFRIDDLTRYVNPIKLYEYLASGIPVVSTALPEVEKHRPNVQTADDSDGFITAVRAALKPESDAARQARQRYAAGFSWNTTLEPLRAAVRG